MKNRSIKLRISINHYLEVALRHQHTIKPLLTLILPLTTFPVWPFASHL